jgi:molybdopterin-guanine dinucleotide biosynthesis protein A
VGLIAADMPFASPDLLAYLLRMIQKSTADAVIPSSKGGPEPLHALYRRESCLPQVRTAIQADLWKMNAWHKDAQVEILDPEETAAAAGSSHIFVNLNTRAEFESAEKLAREMKLR